MSSSGKRKSSKKVSRSARLRKYELAYGAYVKKALTTCEKKSKDTIPLKSYVKHKTEKVRELSSGRKQEKRMISAKKVEKLDKSSKKKSAKKKRPLNTYQMFVKEESLKSKYKGMTATERMYAISKAWKKTKNTK